ncbi:MAG: tail fiber protein [Candidatus Electrothrix sp. AW5]|nr:tail fiber protein [Candidatus Electrothrix gigas]
MEINMLRHPCKVMYLSVLLVLLTTANSWAASVPPLINYQGTLTDAQGQPVANTAKKLTFNIYDAAADGNLIWGPQIFDSVPVINGMFNVILGTTDTQGRLITDAFDATTRFLGITVDEVGQSGGTEITPRQQILSVPYTVQAENSLKLNGEPAQYYITPTGSIMAYYGSTAPDGWLMCDGMALNDSSLADQRFDAIKAFLQAEGKTALPDLRGVFLRGRDSFSTAAGEKGLDPDGARELGTYQEDAFQGHRHRVGYRIGPAVDGSVNFGMFAKDYINKTADDSIEYVQQPISDGNNGTPRFTVETRPKNIAVNYIIKY